MCQITELKMAATFNLAIKPYHNTGADFLILVLGYSREVGQRQSLTVRADWKKVLHWQHVVSRSAATQTVWLEYRLYETKKHVYLARCFLWQSCSWHGRSQHAEIASGYAGSYVWD